MGMKPSLIKEENLTENLDFYSEINPKKETILFSSEKIEPKKEIINKTNNLKNLKISDINKLVDFNKSTKINSTFDTKNDKVKFKFQWKESSNQVNQKLEVLLVGSFLKNWDSYEVMEKNDENGIYECEMYLPKKKHYFKFIINNKWLCSDLYPTTPDESNNINNYIDLTNYQEVETEKLFNDSSNFNEFLTLLKSETTDDDKYNDMKFLNKTAPKIMINYLKDFRIDNLSYQEKLGNNKNYNNYKKKYFYYGNADSCYKKIYNFHPEKIGHLISKISDVFSEKNYFRISLTQRKKKKLITLVYYRPK